MQTVDTRYSIGPNIRDLTKKQLKWVPNKTLQNKNHEWYPNGNGKSQLILGLTESGNCKGLNKASGHRPTPEHGLDAPAVALRGRKSMAYQMFGRNLLPKVFVGVVEVTGGTVGGWKWTLTVRSIRVIGIVIINRGIGRGRSLVKMRDLYISTSCYWRRWSTLKRWVIFELFFNWQKKEEVLNKII